MPKKNKPNPDRKVRFCDPGACDFCLYIGEGDFLCDKHQVIVVADWQPTEDYRKCRPKRKENKNA